MVSNVKKISGTAIEIGAKIDRKAASASSKAFLPTNLDVLTFFLTGEKLYFGNSVSVQIYINLIEV